MRIFFYKKGGILFIRSLKNSSSIHHSILKITKKNIEADGHSVNGTETLIKYVDALTFLRKKDISQNDAARCLFHRFNGRRLYGRSNYDVISCFTHNKKHTCNQWTWKRTCFCILKTNREMDLSRFNFLFNFYLLCSTGHSYQTTALNNVKKWNERIFKTKATILV